MQLKELFQNSIFKIEVHDKDELVDNKIKEDIPLFDIQAWLKVEEEKNKPSTPVDQVDPKTGKKITKREEKKEVKKEENKKKETKKKDIKVGEPIKEVVPEPEINNKNYGVANFNLQDLLKPNVRQIKLQAPIVPNKQYEDVESKNLDLNTTAKKSIHGTKASDNYMDNNAMMLIGITTTIGIGTFKLPEEV